MRVRLSRAARRALLVAVPFALFTAAPEARAQSLRPHIMIIFDTSGSMRENASGNNVGEGTNICGTGTTTSRLYNLKSGIRAALAQAGTDEANFGLMQFPKIVVSSPNTSNWCNNGTTGHYDTTPSRDPVSIPNRTALGSGMNQLHTATSYPGGCLMSTNTTESTYGTWFTNAASEVIMVGVTTAVAGATPVAANYDPVDGNIPAIYRWIDNVELPTNNGPVTDPELHADGLTPLGRSLFYARMYFDNLVKPNDPRAACRQNVVVLVTDGEETCDEGAAPGTGFSLTSCSGGTGFNPFHPVVQACQLYRTSNIKTYVITDTSTGSANDTIATAGGAGSAIRVTLTDANAAKAAVLGIIAETVPPAEVCNGRDDNCNGLIDEGVSNMCPLDVTTLRHCAVESANCLDDNCNGQIDEGFPPNACGQGAGCPIPPERCDGLDNDCDGDIDEGFDVGAACDNGLQGACRRLGIKVCTADGTGTTCDITDSPIGTEVCNGVDDDCDTMVDEDLGPGQGVGVMCGSQIGTCSMGITRCVAGRIVCDQTSMPRDEMCNGLDDDCNTLIDDGIFPETGRTCLCPGLTAAQAGVGTCKAGKLVCRGAEGFVCEGCILPEMEICDGKDNDCDGIPDQAAMCPSGFGCREGACTLLCMPTEFPCPTGYDCDMNGFCVPNRCRNVRCEVEMRCDNNTGSCVDLCFGVNCLPGATCERGQCLDCSNSAKYACQAGYRCASRMCIMDPCAGVTCNGDEYCEEGNCMPLRCDNDCPPGQRCIGGRCRIYMCENVSCAPLYCEWATGNCLPDRCRTQTCPYCVQETGECLNADPCRDLACPANGCWSCALDPAGVAYCKEESDCLTLRVVATSTGGGCACDVGAGTPPSPAAALAALVGLGLLGVLRGPGRRRWRRRNG